MELQEIYKQKLLDSIPVVKGMDVEIDNISPNSLTVGAPLNANINYEGTAFGGSLNTVCILSCYLLVHHLLNTHEVEFESLVIQNSKVDYLRPVDKDFFAISYVADKERERFFKMLKARGVGRINVSSSIRTSGREENHVEFKARFVAKL
ncbi:MAG: thioesterase [Halobacteriovoraceae bacterium]|nr:thioesterase [Halobacteriovoraceae bacterium]|tara:strand:- start:4703 stop:5152 length:450 start_codon:yes stop_codon:yes gene_type:complete